MRPKSSTRDTRLSNKNKGVVTKDEGEVGDGLSSPVLDSLRGQT